MSNIEHVQGLMAEIGPLLELMEVTEFPGETTTWTLVVDADTVVFVDLDPSAGHVTLSGEVAPVIDAPTTLYETLLLFNNQWSATGGLRMALDEPGGAIVQIADLPLADLEISSFQAVVTDFVGRLRIWRDVVDSLGRQSGPSTPTIDPALLDGAIRV